VAVAVAKIDVLLEAVGQALAEKARKALTDYVPYGDVLPDVANTAHSYLKRHLPSDEIRLALGEVASARPMDYAARVANMVEALAKVQSVPFKAELRDYLTHFPTTIRHLFRRPSDPTGRTPPERLEIYKGEQLQLFLPPRRSRFKAADKPAGLDGWQLTELRGIGECSEVWLGHHPDHPPAALKFAVDAETQTRIADSDKLFLRVFDLNEVHGIVPLRGVYTDITPPCLESAFVYGYDLTGLIHEWAWRFQEPKPEAAGKILRRIAEVVAKAHEKKIVHRDLKPSNVIVHPTEGGKFSLWVTDFGWGQIEAVRSLELARGGTPRGEQTRLGHHGAYTPLYASPQQQKKEPPDPRDDVHALGVIWYQLLKRDPHAPAPVGSDWAEEFVPHGLSDGAARLLTACLSTRPEKRPNDAGQLVELMAEESTSVSLAVKPADDGSRVISLKPQSSTMLPAVTTARGKVFAQDAASTAAASLLRSGGAAPVAKSGPSLNAGGSKLVRNGLGMTFTAVPAGLFEMGSPDGEAGRKPDETPRHAVRFGKSIYVSIFPVTQSQFEKVLGKNPSFFTQSAGGGADFPVEQVTWYDAERFCQRLGRWGDESVFGRSYRLPTEAEWEYFCRAGTTTAYSTGEALGHKEGHFAAGGGQQGRPCPVGQHAPNPWGLFDCHGNILEWVADWYDEYYYFDSPGNDPKGPVGGTLKIARGGSWADPGSLCRSAARRALNPDRPSNTVGFRVVMISES
jgi:formylglycine-generating enzyme required for sulfatase activity